MKKSSLGDLNQIDMSNFKQLYLDALVKANWFFLNENVQLSTYQRNWLVELDSMTARLKKHCVFLRVDAIKQYTISSNCLTGRESELIGNHDCLVREVILQGDDKSWLIARSLIPYPTMSDSEQDIANLGATPLGQRIFSDTNSYRDEIEMAFVDVNHQVLLARRSRLWIRRKPLLVAELFLPSAPIYKQES